MQASSITAEDAGDWHDAERFVSCGPAGANASVVAAVGIRLGASESLRFDGRGRLLWRRSELAVDGVIVRGVQDGLVFGDAEWDPPDGWEPFRLHLDSGVVCGPRTRDQGCSS